MYFPTGYRMMFDYLDSLYQRTRADELGGLLGYMSLLGDGEPAGPAYGPDWKRSGRPRPLWAKGFRQVNWPMNPCCASSRTGLQPEATALCQTSAPAWRLKGKGSSGTNAYAVF